MTRPPFDEAVQALIAAGVQVQAHDGNGVWADCPLCRDSGAPDMGMRVYRQEDGTASLGCLTHYESEVLTFLGFDASATAEPPLDVEPWSVFREKGQEPVPMLVNEVWPAGALGFLAAEPKAGKTWFALAMSLAVAAGRPFLGTFVVPEPRPVLYLALEGSRNGLTGRVGALARGMGLDPDGEDLDGLQFLYKPRGINLSDPEWADRIVDAARGMDAGLVVVDVLRRAASVREDGQGVGDFADLLRNLAGLEEDGRSLALLHHNRKSSEASKGKRAAELMAGSNALWGALDVGLFIRLEGKEHEHLYRLEVEARDMQAPCPFRVQLAGAGTGWNGSWRYEDTLRTEVDLRQPLGEVEILERQLRELLKVDPELTKQAASGRLGVGRTSKGFVTAWERVQAVCAPYIGGARTHAHTTDGAA